ncbi:hypothetical protein SAY86_031746 [Trapa natans]|uniref:VQ domain-containing protein n=1 Tax=Trapa natans TaxID=22666 RepID=A0AAN7M458_TRANT|nr:hypothetical protein SAY86_031746 [Trapa natans]
MDSGNSSGSMYSSGGDEEYDSRGESISLSVFLNGNPNPPQAYLDACTLTRHDHQLQAPQVATAAPHDSPTIPSMTFDPLSNIFDPLSTGRSVSLAVASAVSSQILNLDTAVSWYKTPRSYSHAADLSGFGKLPPTVQLEPPPLDYNQQGQIQTTCFRVASEPEGSLKQLGFISGSTNELATSTATVNAQVRNPKKRSRASRRAPTTVLTTDTNNFRDMVQEFTGIPAPPFTASSPYQRSRVNLFSSASAAPSYLLRPFSQKPQLPPVLLPFSSPSSFPTSIMDALASSTTAGNGIASTELNLVRPSSTSFLSQSISNPLLNLQSHFQAPCQKYPTAGSSIIPAKTLVTSDNISRPTDSNSQLKIGALEEFGIGQMGLQLHPRLLSLQPSDKTLSKDINNNGNENNGAPPGN